MNYGCALNEKVVEALDSLANCSTVGLLRVEKLVTSLMPGFCKYIREISICVRSEVGYQ